jgi:type IV secretory pathway VirB6-like protein
MVFKNKLSTIYNLVIAILISLLMLMLYLGNYNLIEGNTTVSQLINDLDSSITTNKNKGQVLKATKIYNSACSSIQNMNNENAEFISSLGGANTLPAQSVHTANQVVATLCSKNAH